MNAKLLLSQHATRLVIDRPGYPGRSRYIFSDLLDPDAEMPQVEEVIAHYNRSGASPIDLNLPQTVVDLEVRDRRGGSPWTLYKRFKGPPVGTGPEVVCCEASDDPSCDPVSSPVQRASSCNNDLVNTANQTYEYKPEDDKKVKNPISFPGVTSTFIPGFGDTVSIGPAENKPRPSVRRVMPAAMRRDTLVANYFEFWRCGGFPTFEEMLVSLTIALWEIKTTCESELMVRKAESK
jgi:hypothetical protein